MKTLTVVGRALSFFDEGSGSPLVFLHAFPLGPAQWKEQIALFSLTRRCIALAAPGLGSDAFSSPPSLDEYAEDLAHLLDSLKINEPIVLCGLSLGGYTAQIFAHRFPERLRALVLCDTRAGADDAATRQKRDETIAFTLSHTTAEIWERLHPNLFGDTSLQSRPKTVEAAQQIALHHAPAAFAAATAALRDRPDMKAWLPEIRVPTLLIFGAEDKLAPPEEIAALQTIRGARLETIDGAGHLANLEAPDAFNDVLAKFFTEID
ncbi:MAG TPA: alpha/beta fold hydrolase [Abditibacteriaceae bacterium]|jgi:pimeloyl-ACP methyl ester carboxylesterase